MKITTDRLDLDRQWVIDALMSAYWAHEFLTPAKIGEAIDHSLCFGLYKEKWSVEHGCNVIDCQIGFARVVTDGVTFSSVMDVWIDPEERGKGHGTRLMKEVLAHPLVKDTICIISTRDAFDFYVHFGFELCTGTMKRNPQ
jgi:GNAT superfamily N-acetyltransferase